MAADQAELTEEPDRTIPPARRRWQFVLAGAALLLALAVAFAWASREKLADDFLAARLRELGLPATYEIEQVGVEQQVLRNIVIGDPRHPDLTIERAEAQIEYRFGLPAIGRITVTRPRLYGSWRGGKPSFGSLDKVLFAETAPRQPFRLPDLDVGIVDGRGLLETDSGPVGLKLVGAGKLRGGFSGTLAAIAPEAAVSGCRLRRATLYGTVSVTGEKPSFAGPVRVAGGACPDGVMFEQVGLRIDGTLDRGLDGGEATLGLETGALGGSGLTMAALKGTGKVTYRKQALTARYDLAAQSLAASSFGAGVLHAEGSLRSQHGLGRIEVDGTLDGERLALGQDLDAALARAEKAGADTLAAPLLAQLRAALRREAPGSKLTAGYLARMTGEGLALTVPQASLQGGSGQVLLAVSRFQLVPGGGPDGGRVPQLSGNLMTGGAGLPQISGRMERPSGGEAVLRLAMADYRAGASRLAVPSLTLAQGRGGALGFVGRAVLSGPLPGGAATNLAVPIDGNWSGAGGLSVWRRCTPVGFDRLALANLTIERRNVTLCPPPGGAIVRSTGSGTRIAAGATGLDLAGRLGSTPIRIASGPVGFAMPGALSARAVDIALGPAATASRFRLSNLTAQVGPNFTGDVAGRFDGTDMRLAAVPLDLLGAQGSWRYAGGVLSIADGTFRLIDRQPLARFEPLNASGGTFTLRNNVIDANALMAEPTSGREVVRAVVRHDLGSGRGRADLTVPGIAFDGKLQPVALTRLALGVVANVAGALRGEGTIQWNEAGQTSSGRFTTDGLDFAAAFGPVKGAAGTIVFTDLLNLVTAPDQRLRIASINPGIEATDGELRYELRPNSQLAVLGARWPFLDGTLTLDPTVMNLGTDETRRYTLRVEGIEAAKFVERLDLGNITATGRFDGLLPLVFDQNGGRIEGGALTSRPPGGSVSYVGALSYKDLSTMANFAFEALKALNYKEMRIGMDGALAGEIVTRVRFTGVTQGEGTRQNFLTKRIAGLPIQFNINIRASFIELIGVVKRTYDPAYIKDPREIGLLDAQGRPVAPGAPSPPTAPAIKPQDIQPSDSEKSP
ncbi:MAG: YdbH domain-containing protein [Novosphingobium sp.]